MVTISEVAHVADESYRVDTTIASLRGVSIRRS
jgi:hypothetical protein